ncbi:MAG: hypothetical protein WDZ30_11055 [Cellvibrionaceae bacterium]
MVAGGDGPLLVRQGNHAAQGVGEQTAVAAGVARGVAGQYLVDPKPGVVDGAQGIALQFGDGLGAIVEIAHGLAVDGAFDAPAQVVVGEVGLAVGAVDGGELIAGAPGVADGPLLGLPFDEVAEL